MRKIYLEEKIFELEQKNIESFDIENLNEIEENFIKLLNSNLNITDLWIDDLRLSTISILYLE